MASRKNLVDIKGYSVWKNGSASAVSDSNSGRFIYDEIDDCFKISEDTNPFSCLVTEAALTKLPIRTETANYTAVSETDYTILVDATSGDVTISLPTALSALGRVFNVKKIDASTNSVFIDPNGSESLDNDTDAEIKKRYTSLTVQSDGTGWWII